MRSRRDTRESMLVRLAPDSLARWPRNAVWKIRGKPKGGDSIWSASVEDFHLRDFERDQFRTRFRQQVKELDGASHMLCARIRCRYLDCGIQVKSAKFASGVPPAATLLRVCGVGWIEPLWRNDTIVGAAATNNVFSTHSHAAVMKESSEIRIDRIYAISTERFKNGAVAEP